VVVVVVVAVAVAVAVAGVIKKLLALSGAIAPDEK
jgi:hypothetical protein